MGYLDEDPTADDGKKLQNALDWAKRYGLLFELVGCGGGWFVQFTDMEHNRVATGMDRNMAGDAISCAVGNLARLKEEQGA